MELHLRMNDFAVPRGDLCPADLHVGLIKGCPRERCGMEDAGVGGKTRRNDRAYVLRERVQPLTNPIGGFNLFARGDILPAHLQNSPTRTQMGDAH
jgi:hypothetical protein